MNQNYWEDDSIPNFNIEFTVEDTVAMLDNTLPDTTKMAKAPRIRVRAAWTVLERIKKKMKGNLEHRLRQTVFGHYLDLESVICESPLLLCVARHQIPCDNPSNGISYVFGNDFIHFTPIQFCLITGFRFGQITNTIFNGSPSSFSSRIFPGTRDVKLRHLEDAFDSDWSQLSEDDCLRICLLMLLELGFKGTQRFESIDKMVLNLVDDLEAWNNFPSGSYLWQSTYMHVYDLSRRHQQGNAGFSLPGCVWPFKMWIYEVFPEFKEMVSFFKTEAIPRFLGWGPGKRVTTATVEHIFQSTQKNEHYRPIQTILPTSQEMQTEWYISSVQFLDSIRIESEVPRNMQPNSDTMHSSGEIPNVGVADGFEGYATLTPMATQTARKRRSAIHDGGNVSNTDELESSLVEKFISILDLNNEKLSSIIDAKFEAKLMSLSLDHGRVHSVGKPEVDSFVNFNDVGDNELATVKLQPCDDIVCNNTEQLVNDAPTATVRRSERLVKPGPSMLSPFVLFKNVSKRNKNKEDSTCTDKQIQKIRDWYIIERSLVNKTDSRTRKLGKTMAGEVGPQFWSSLLGDDGSGWLSDDEQRNDTDHWSILPPYFQMTVIQCDAHRRMERYFNGSLIPIPPISEVDEVYVPLNIKNVHWNLAVFHLRNRTLTI
ncbi:putative papain-like cysteine peptidase superfamily [Helianthus annuus]|nr:putative papain-like cysteine peptidase superfamily [Helianthus annuus]